VIAWFLSRASVSERSGAGHRFLWPAFFQSRKRNRRRQKPIVCATGKRESMTAEHQSIAERQPLKTSEDTPGSNLQGASKLADAGVADLPESGARLDQVDLADRGNVLGSRPRVDGEVGFRGGK
jgi:hypothetical protein